MVGLLVVWWALLLASTVDMGALLFWVGVAAVVFYVGWACTVWAKKGG